VLGHHGHYPVRKERRKLSSSGTVAYKLGRPYNSTMSIQASSESDMCIVTLSVVGTEPIDIRSSTVNGSGRFLDTRILCLVVPERNNVALIHDDRFYQHYGVTMVCVDGK
jgi:hypothetical protein